MAADHDTCPFCGVLVHVTRMGEHCLREHAKFFAWFFDSMAPRWQSGRPRYEPTFFTCWCGKNEITEQWGHHLLENGGAQAHLLEHAFNLKPQPEKGD